MSKFQIVIADTNEQYLSTIEYKILKELDDKVDLEIITDVNYFNQYFSTPKTAEIVAVCEEMYTKELQKHNINHLFVLAESNDNDFTADLSVKRIYKYTGIKEIYNELIYESIEKIDSDENENKETQIIALHSAIGGSGKTSLSLGLALNLVQNHKKVLYVSTESIQDFAYYLSDQSMLGNEAIREIRKDRQQIYPNIRHMVRNEGFSYIPPFQSTLDIAGLDFSIYDNLIMTAKNSKEYDFIIVDMEAGYAEERMRILNAADRVLMVLQQDEVSIFKTQRLLDNIDLRDSEKYIFICNRYDDLKRNAYIDSRIQTKISIGEYIEKIETEIYDVKQIASLRGIQRLTYMFF